MVIFEHPWADFTIYDFKDKITLYVSFTCYMYFEWAVSFTSLFWWTLSQQHLFLKFLAAAPRHTLSALTMVDTMHLHTTSLAWQLPSSGQVGNHPPLYHCIGLLVLFFISWLHIVHWGINSPPLKNTTFLFFAKPTPLKSATCQSHSFFGNSPLYIGFS